MGLHKTIRKQIELHGVDIVKTKQFVNVLDDLGAFKAESVAAKKIMRGLLDFGFADIICKYYQTTGNGWQNDVRKCASDYAAKSGYENDIIDHLVDELLLAAEIASMSQTADTLQQSETASKRKSNKRNKIIATVAGVALLVGGAQTTSYLTSADARAQYEATMSTAQGEADRGNFVEALTLYQKAADEYDGSYASTTYKNDALDKAAEMSDNIVSDWSAKVTSQLQNGQVAQAKALTLALPSNLVLRDKTEQEYNVLTSRIDSEIDHRTAALVDELLSDIYSNKGKLSADAKSELEQMVAVVPDNYWLNFIMRKAE